MRPFQENCRCGHQALQHAKGRCLALRGYNALCGCKGFAQPEFDSPLKAAILQAAEEGDHLARRMAMAVDWL